MSRYNLKSVLGWATFLICTPLVYYATTIKGPEQAEGRQCDGPQLDRMDRYESVKRRVKNNPEVIFVGDSITNYLTSPEGQQIFERYYGNFKSAVTAVGGDTSGNTLWMIKSLPKIAPKVMVLLTGTNDNRCDWTAATTAGNVKAIIAYAQTSWPGVKIIVVPTLPRDSDPEAMRGDAIIRELSGVKDVTLVSMKDLFYRPGQPIGLLDDEEDRLHPTPEMQDKMAARLSLVIMDQLIRTTEGDVP